VSDEGQRQQADAGSGVGVGGARAEGGLRPGSGLGLSQEVKSARGTGRAREGGHGRYLKRCASRSRRWWRHRGMGPRGRRSSRRAEGEFWEDDGCDGRNGCGGKCAGKPSGEELGENLQGRCGRRCGRRERISRAAISAVGAVRASLVFRARAPIVTDPIVDRRLDLTCVVTRTHDRVRPKCDAH